jgi:hypothetical protein
VEWGDGNVETEEVVAPGAVSKPHTYTTAGVYEITLTVTDKDNGAGTQTFHYLSVYYQGGVPVGNRQFTMDFQTVNFEFNATTVSSLIVADGIGILRGSGTINGQGVYDFLVVGSEAANTIRVK